MTHGIPGGAHVGSLCLVTNLLNGKSSYAIVADVGPHNEIGGGSIALARRLDIDDDARGGGAPANSVRFVVFPGSGQGQGVVPGNDEIDKVGAEKVAAGPLWIHAPMTAKANLMGQTLAFDRRAAIR